MSKLKTFVMVLNKIVIAILLIAAFNLVMMPKYINENQDGRVLAEMYRQKKSPDIVFLGSSTLYSGVVPAVLYEIYGQSSYVCSTSSQTPWNSYWILKEAIDVLKPKMVVFDIGFLTVEDDYVEEVSNRKAFDAMRPSINKYKGIKRAMSSDESLWSYAFPVLRYHTRYTDLTMDDFKYAFYKPNVTYNGYVMSTLIANELPEPLAMENAENNRMGACSREYLQNILTLCRNEGIDIMLIKTPSYQAKWGVDFENDIAGIAALNGVSYINFDNYQDQIGINWSTDTPDSGRHLNIYGAEKFSVYIGSVIAQCFDIPDRRTDKGYSKFWEKEVNRYIEDKEAKIVASWGE